MRLFSRQLTSLILPVTALVLVPGALERDWLPGSPAAAVTGLIVAAFGAGIMAHTIRLFIRVGRGTLAPWSPTKHLVISGLYAYVRNPMILGVLLVLLGEALWIPSWRILAWAIAFFLLNTIYFVYAEEPGLESRYGEAYRRYKRNVPRWIPRLTPYREEFTGT